MAKVPSYAKKTKFKQGKFRPLNPEKYIGKLQEITFRSSWEQKFMTWCDLNPSVVKWNSEGLVIPYFSQADGKERRYFIDFMIQIRDAEGKLRTLIVEIKPEAQTKPPKPNKRNPKRYLEECYTYQVNQDKWAHAAEWAKQNGVEFRILNEYDLGIARRK